MYAVKTKWIIVFIVAALMLNTIMFFTLTVNGYSYLYSAGVFLSTKKITAGDGVYDEYTYFKKSAKWNKIFILEPEHPADIFESKGNVGLAVDFLSFLNSGYDINYILEDISYAAGALINLYINGGSEELLDEVFGLDGAGTLIPMRKYYYKALREYNMHLPENKRLVLWGLDVESDKSRFSERYLDYLLGLVSNKVKPAAVAAVLSASRDDRYKYFDDIRLSLEKNELLYKELFVEEFFNFSMLVNNYFTSDYDERQTVQSKALSLVKIYQKNKKGKYYGVFSSAMFINAAHSLETEIGERTAVVNLINEQWFPEKGELLYSVNNKGLSRFVGYRNFIYGLYGIDKVERYNGLGDVFFLLNAGAKTNEG